MQQPFDAYQLWLGIAAHERPANHYRLLGIAPYESDFETIRRAVDQREAYVRSVASQDPAAAEEVLEDLATARHLLLNPAFKAQYDAMLAQPSTPPAVTPSPAEPVTPPAVTPPAAAHGGVSPAMPAAVTPAAAAPSGAVEAPVIVTGDAPSGAAARRAAGPQNAAANGTRTAAAKNPWTQPGTIVALSGGGLVLVMILVLAMAGGGGKKDRRETSSRTSSSRSDHDNEGGRPSRPPRRTKTSSWRKGTPPPIGSRTMADLMNQGEDTPLDKSSTTGLLAAARAALADRQIETARNHLDAALDMARSPTEKTEAERVQRLVESLEAFWKAVREVSAKLQAGDEIRIGNNLCVVVQNRDDRLMVRADGKNREFHVISEMPRQLAIGIFQKRMPGDGHTANLRIGAFLAVDKWGDRQEARTRLEEAGSAGRALLPEVELAGPVRTRPKADTGRDPVMHADKEKPAEWKPPPKKDNRLPVPDKAALAKAEEQVREIFQDEFAAARDKEGKVALAKKMYDLAEETEDDPALRYFMYSVAHDMAVDLGDAESFNWAVIRIADHFKVDALAMKSDDLITCWREQTDSQVRWSIYQYSLQLLDEAIEEKHYVAADRASRVALAGAKIDKDYAKARQIEEKIEKIRELK